MTLAELEPYAVKRETLGRLLERGAISREQWREERRAQKREERAEARSRRAVRQMKERG